MPSSIFSSKHPAMFYSKILFGFCAITIVVLELMSNSLLKHHSVTYDRISQQYTDALTARPALPGEPTSVLMVGNSLLLYGVDVDRLSALTSGRTRVYPIFLEATGYYDWLYTLRRLFRDGSRPQIVVLGVGLNEFYSNGVRLDYAPLLFFDPRDLLSIASTVKMDRTDTVDLWLTHSSYFWDMRTVIRTEVLRHTIPHCKQLFALFSVQPPLPQGAKFDSITTGRLERLRRLCEAHGARLIILVPPTPSSESPTAQLSADARQVGVQTLIPIDPATLPTKYYLADDIHLNPDGAGIFTTALAADLIHVAPIPTQSDPN